MNQLTNILEGILDSDLDVELTYGDLYGYVPDFGLRAPSEFNGYAWDKSGFWAQYESVRNSWTERADKLGTTRTRHIKSDIRHGFVMFILTRPIDSPMDQRAVDGYVRQMNEWCDRNKLEMDVHVKKVSNGFEFAMWNIRLLGAPEKSFMGKFVITRKAMTEGLLDADYDVKDSDLNIGNVYPITHHNIEVMVSIMERTFNNAENELHNTKFDEPEHVVDLGYGRRHPARYFLDWLAAQQVGMLNDEEFTARKPKLVEAFNAWLNNKRFTITMVKYMKEKTIYFNYNKKPILRVNFK